MILVALVVGVVLSLVFGLQLFRVVSGLVFPPEPPTPPGLTLSVHENLDHGVDEWVYSSAALSPCEIVAFYEGENSLCTTTWCDGGAFNSPGYALEEVAVCIGTDTFSIFGLRWEAVIYTRYISGEEVTYVDVRRDVLWSGPAPAATTSPALE
ncbi:MAG: hypothetical protein OHK0046_01160 [Anaerolineae bacterium]